MRDELERFAEAHGLIWQWKYRDEQATSTTIVDDAGDRYQLWLDRRDATHVVLKAWNYRRRGSERRAELSVRPEELYRGLERVFTIISSWIKESGHTRTTSHTTK